MIEILAPIAVIGGVYYITNTYAAKSPTGRSRQTTDDIFDNNSISPNLIPNMFSVPLGPSQPAPLTIYQSGTDPVNLTVEGYQDLARTAKKAQVINSKGYLNHWDSTLVPTGNDGKVTVTSADERQRGFAQPSKTIRNVRIPTTTVAGRASNASLM